MKTRLSVPRKVKTHPSVNAAILLNKVARLGRFYYMARAVDQATHDGRGYLNLAAFSNLLTDSASSYRLCTRRYMRQILNEAQALGLLFDDGSTLRIAGMAAGADALGVRKLRGRPVNISIDNLLGGIQLLRAHLYASVESARTKPGPQSRASLHERTGVSPSTQRVYDALLGRESETNIVVTNTLWTQANVQEHAWEHGHNIFPFIDHQGIRGPAGQKYIAFQLPSTRSPVHEQAPRGRQKKINARLNLVNTQDRGNEPDVTAVYHPDAKAAAKASKRNPQVAHYYLETDDFVQDAEKPAGLKHAKIWSVIP